MNQIRAMIVCAAISAFAVASADADTAEDAAADAGGWKSYSLDRGSIEVKTRIAEKLDSNGSKIAWIEYEASQIADVDLARCVAVLKDIPEHRKWLNASASEALQSISSGEWLAYYRFDAVWPIPSSDCVARVSLAENPDARSASLSIVAAPDAFESRKLKRYATFTMSFSLRDLGNGNTEIRTAATISPPIKIPFWMIEAGYPGAAADILRKLAKLAREGRV